MAGCGGPASSGDGDGQDGSGTAGTSAGTGMTAGLTAAMTTATSMDTGGPGDTTLDPSDTTAATSDPGDTTDGTTAGEGSSTGEPEPVCDPVTSVCLASAPAGWTGPVVLMEGPADVALPICAGGYPTLSLESLSDPVADPAICECNCGPAQNVSCSTSITVWPAADCTAGFPVIGTTYALPNTSCVNVADTTFSWWSLSSTHSGGSCAPSSNMEIPVPSYERQIRMCGTEATSRGCEADEVCAPIPSQPLPNVSCIYQEGDHECPEGDYSERSIHYRDHDDDRTCAPACTCAAPDGNCTGASANLYATDTCNLESAPGSGTLPSEGCFDAALQPTIRGVRRTGTASFSGDCAEQGYQPSGELTPTDPVTVCCQP